MNKRGMMVVGLVGLLTSSAWGWTEGFGLSGRDGLSGVSGADGRDGQSVLLQVDGSPKQLILNGGDAGSAQPGQDGEDAWSCHQGRPWNDLIGANGGDGGNGGTGGTGGDGGDITLYYTNASDLKQIYIQSVGGRGGIGAPGGREGRPCYCQQYRWELRRLVDVKKPDGTIVQEERRERFSCFDGSMGRRGSSGYNGPSGSQGSLTLIKSGQLLAANILSTGSDISQLPGLKVQLENNEFVRKSGALNLVASGSQLSDTYSEFVGRNIVTAEIVWKAPRPAAELAGQAVAFNYSASGVNVRFPSDVWEVTSTVINGNHKVITVEQALLESEIRQVTLVVEGKGEATRVRIKDLAPQKELLTNTLSLKAWANSGLFGSDSRIYDDAVPADALSVDAGDTVINLAKLPARDVRNALKNGAKITLRIHLVRSLNGHSTDIDTGELKYNTKK